MGCLLVADLILSIVSGIKEPKCIMCLVDTPAKTRGPAAPAVLVPIFYVCTLSVLCYSSVTN